MKKVSLIIVLALLTASFAQAAVLLDENFDSLAVGALPANYTQDAPSDGNPTNSGVSADLAASGSNSFKFVDDNTQTYSTRMHLAFSEEATGGDVNFSYKLYYQKTDLGFATTIALGNNKNGVSTIYMNASTSTSTDWVNEPYYYGHAGYLNPADVGQWIEMSGTFGWDSVSSTYTTLDWTMYDGAGNVLLTTAGDPIVLENWPTRADRMGTMNEFYVSMGGASVVGTSLYMDDIFVELVPEPATMLLLGLGGLVLRRRK